MKGFTLPTSNTTSNGSFSNLITQTSANANTIVQAPLMFVRGGYIIPGSSLSYAGSYGYYWSSESYASPNAYNLFFYSNHIDPSENFNNLRYFGYYLRCVALGG